MTGPTSVLHRHPKTRNFTQIENSTIRDSGLSYRATGLLIYLLSLKHGSPLDSNTLAQHKTEGRDAVRTAYAELIAAGYVHRSKMQRAHDGRWITVIHVYEVPRTDFQASGTQASGFQSSDSQALSLKGSKTENKEGISGFFCPQGCGDSFPDLDARDEHYALCDFVPACDIRTEVQ